MLVLMDLELFRHGASWTPFHYEILAPLAAWSLRGKAAWLSSVAGTLLVGGLLVLYFEFGLTLHLAETSAVFLLVSPLLAAAWLLPVLYQGWQRRQPPWTLLLALVGLAVVDKGLSHDKLASAFLPHFLNLQSPYRSVVSPNVVYRDAALALQHGQGVVLIVLEGLGVPKDVGTIDALRQRHPTLLFKSQPYEGGSTVPAELRYLCGVNGSLSDAANCLPRLAGPRPSVALHGNTLAYFNRYSMYGQMGFQTLLGKRELSGLRGCSYAYDAVCDAALLERLVLEVQAKECRGFFYMLSIDAHFPYGKYGGRAMGMFGDLEPFLSAMNKLVLQFPGCHVVIAGDHPPPLTADFLRQHVLTVEARP